MCRKWLFLFPELLLAIESPAEEPAGILDRDDAARDGMAAERIPLANFFDILRDGIVQRGDGRTFPVGFLGFGAELIRVAERGVLRRDPPPEIPAIARFDGGVKARRLVLRTHGTALHTAAVGNEKQVVLGQVDGLHLALMVYRDGAGLLAADFNVELHIRYLCLIKELDAVVFQVTGHGQDDGLILVIPGKTQGREIRQAADVVDIPLEVELHFQRAVPVFKGKHSAPVKPEVGGENLLVKNIGDLFILQLLVRGEEEFHDLQRALIRDGKFAIRVGILALFLRRAAKGGIGVGLVQPVIFIQHAGTLGFQRRDRTEQIPHDLKVVVHLAAAAHDIADIIFIAIAGTAGDGVFFQNVDMLTLHLAVTHQEAGGRQCSQAAADQIGGLSVDAFGLFGGSKSFIITAGIIHTKTSLGFMLTLFLGCCCLGCL